MRSRYFLAKKSRKETFVLLNDGGICGASTSRALFDEKTCPICLDPCSETTTIDGCMHLFCFPCISAWGRITPRCPLCKSKFQRARCAASSLSEEKIFIPPITVTLCDDVEEVYDDNSPSEDGEDENINSNNGYEFDGFVVGDDDLEFDDDNECKKMTKFLIKQPTQIPSFLLSRS